MKPHQTLAAGVAVLMLTIVTGCTREDRATSAPPAPPAAAPAASVASPPEPPNPPSITGVAPQQPAPVGPGPVERAGRAIGERVDDATITAKVKTALLQAPDVKGIHVNVETEKGAVQLSGFVESQTQIERAVQIARETKGVKEVHNKMSLKSGK